jgi:hypothetical protein
MPGHPDCITVREKSPSKIESVPVCSTEKVKTPVLDGVPDIVPPAERVRPVGRLPE